MLGAFSGQDLVDVELRLRASAGGLFVLAREHLADQTEREELKTDHDQEHAEREQRALADRVSQGLDDCQVDEDRKPGQAENEPEPAEKMQGPVPVTADERHREQSQESTDVALDAVARAPVFSRTMVDGELRDPEAPVLREYGDQTMQFAVQRHAANDLCPVRLQPAIHIVQPKSGDPPRHPVEDSRQDTPAQRVAAAGLPARNEVEALVELHQQPGNLCGIVLQVGVDRDDGLTGSLAEPGRECDRLPEVSTQPDDAYVLMRVVEPGQRSEGPVDGAVVDEHGLPVLLEGLECSLELLVQQRDRVLLVV